MGKRVVTRQKGLEFSDNRSVKIASGVKDYWTRRFQRDKSWKLYRKKQYKKVIKVSKNRIPKNGEHWRYKRNVSWSFWGMVLR